MTITYHYGTDQNDLLMGGDGDNLIDGLGGADTMMGGKGDDWYWVDNPGDVVIEYAGEGTADRVLSQIYEYTLAANVEELYMENGAFIGRGNELDNTIRGTAGNNHIDGQAGADTMMGFGGDDNYWVDNPGDVVIENAGEGTDSVISSRYEYSLAANVEMLILQGGAFIGRGNELDNIIVGTTGNNLIDGLGGADTMRGGGGDDTYGVDNPGDVVTENAGEGTADRVVSRLHEYNLAANVEELWMEGNAFIGRGNDLDNTIWGTADSNRIDGLGGADTMRGGGGNDHYWVDNPGDVVIEYAGEGTDDRVVSRLYEYTLAANVEELFMEGNAVVGRGNDLENWIWGTAGNNQIDGLGGADVMIGGGGDDWYGVDNFGDLVFEDAGEGTADRVVSRTYEYTLNPNVEELSMEGNAFIGRGNDLDNTIWGTAGDNRIDGLGGADTMAGGAGNDYYWIDNPGDVVIENAGQGTADRVVSRISEYTLAANVEELWMEGNAFIGRGNDLDNTIWGTGGDNRIDGLAGADTMIGGSGTDYYGVDNLGDVVIENAGEGTDDRVVSRLYEYTLAANVEELYMEGGAFIGRGNDLTNWIVGTAGDNGIDGLAGADYMMGLGGDDWYGVDNPGDVVIENAGQGAADGVWSSLYEYTLAANVEYLSMLGGAVIGRGNELNNLIWGTAGNNQIDGLGGADTMIGGAGDDWYGVDNPGDVVIEYAGEGTADRVVSRLHEYNLAANVEELSMEGGAFIGRGNELNNIIVGSAGNNLIDGLGGNDTMRGGAGNDHYWIDNPGDVVIENAGEGTADRVVSRIYEYTLAANVEELSMENGAFIGRGNELNNTIWGTAGNNQIDGLGGADTMIGGGGDDWYDVDNLGDTVIENAGQGTADRVVSRIFEYNLAANVESLVMQGGAVIGHGNELDNIIVGTAGDNQIDGLDGADTMAGGAGDDLYWVDNPGDVVMENAGEGSADGVISRAYEYNLAENVEVLSMQGGAFIGRGNELNNIIVGTAGNNLIDGLGGADTMRGGAGNDHYWIDNPGDVVIENAGEGTADRVVSRIYEYTLAANVEELSMEGFAFIGRGNDLNNIIVGTAGNNLIDGLGGADTMRGGAGNDHYWVDNPGDAVIENAGEGTADRVVSRIYEYTLAANVEDLSMEGNAFLGRGNALDNIIVGTAGYNHIDGLAGADTMKGGDGNDHYGVDNPGDVVIENPGEGTADRVVSRINEYTLAANVEELYMENGSFIGRGNDLNNIIVGTGGDNNINGQAGADTMMGGSGDDWYWVDNPGDVVIEYADEGTADRVMSRIYEYKLAANVEELSMGNGAFIGRGNDLNNTIRGTAGDNLIDGGGGNDLLYGDDGADTYVFARGDGADRIFEGFLYFFQGEDGSWRIGGGYSGTDVLQFQGDISADQIWLRVLGNNLEVSVIGTSDKITIEDWYLDNNRYPQHHLEQIKSSDGRTLLDGSVNNLVQAMAAFAPPGPGQTSLPASYATALAPVIAASWF